MSKVENWIKRIPQKHQANLDGLGRFKISLNGCENKTQIKRAKEYLNLYYEKHIVPNFLNLDRFESQKILKISLQEYLFQLRNRDILHTPTTFGQPAD